MTLRVRVGQELARQGRCWRSGWSGEVIPKALWKIYFVSSWQTPVCRCPWPSTRSGIDWAWSLRGSTSPIRRGDWGLNSMVFDFTAIRRHSRMIGSDRTLSCLRATACCDTRLGIFEIPRSASWPRLPGRSPNFLSMAASDSDARIDEKPQTRPAVSRISSQARRTWRSSVWV